MPQLPDGDLAPLDGALPPAALDAFEPGDSPFGVYLHVPFCRVRCGYCDFNTYTLGELDQDGAQATGDYLRAVRAELELAARVLGTSRRVDTVFMGGGTPTMLSPQMLGELLGWVEELWGLAPGAEVSVEANPDSVDEPSLQALAAAGVTRVSFGMQSAVPHVLEVLERTHDPARLPTVIQAARDCGLAVSLDLIYGTPGESLADWRTSLDAALACEPDHISAYALVVEEGTRLAAQVRRGERSRPDPDDEADKYLLADELLTSAGFAWYEVSNWTRSEAARSRHNEGYWLGGHWWGAGPGAHSHVGGVRWWNAKHPRAYAARLAAGQSPAAAREVLDADQRRDELVLLRIRTREGLPLDAVEPAGRGALAGLVADGLVDGAHLLRARRVVLTRKGRLLADLVVRNLLGY